MSRLQTVRRAAIPLAAATLLALGAAGAQATPVAGYVVVHSMSGESGGDGQGPQAALAQTAGTDSNFYGTAFYLGLSDFRCGCTLGGTVFKMVPKGQITPMHTFTGPDGLAPASGVVQGADKLWYGVTSGGGDHGAGTFYKVAGDGTGFTVLHSFDGATEGSYVSGGALVRHPDGNYYGTAMNGGAHGMGTAFRLTPTGTLTVLHAFAGAPGDGGSPRGQLTLGSDGNLYGTTVCGNASAPMSNGGCGGTVYRLSTSGAYTLLASFSSKNTGYHSLSGVTQVGNTLYGTTTAGGPNDFGTIFKVNMDGTGFALLYTFQGGLTAPTPNGDGMRPVGKLLLATDGNLYGTTSNGGSHASIYPKGDGTVFRITPSGVYTLLGDLGATATDASHPVAGLTMGKDGMIYGTADDGGINGTGAIFKFPVPTN